MKSFHSDSSIKATYHQRVLDHAAADQIVKGQYWQGGKGCAVGCTIHGDDHSRYETELGIPQILAHLEDRIFESLPNHLAMTWPQRFLEAIPVGVDLSKVWPQFAIFLLTDMTQCASRHPQCDVVAQAYKDELAGVRVDWMKVTTTAAYAAAYAAYADADAAYVATYAAYAAADATVRTAQSEKLLELLREAK